MSVSVFATMVRGEGGTGIGAVVGGVAVASGDTVAGISSSLVFL